MQLDYFIPSDSLTLFEAGQRFFIEELDLELNSVTAQAVPARAFLHGYADTTPALGKVRDIYFLGQLNDQALAENAARRRGQVNLKTAYAEVQPPAAGRAYPGLALFALDLAQAPTRGEVAELTRTFNRASNFLPVLLLLRYPAPATGAGDAGVRLALAASERLEYVQTWRPGEKVGKVTTLFDIDPRPDRLHTGHQQILQRLRVPTDVDTLRSLSQHWNRVLSVQVLNETFYRELSNWYFWAVRQVQTPPAAGDTTDNDHEVRHATALIRLITRLVFTWFLKEKNLVPAKLFDEAFVYGAAGPLLEKPTDAEQSSNYYKAVLQNLFFATLNTEMRDQENKPNRQFLPNKKYGNPGFGEAGYLRYESFFTKAGRSLALDLFNRVPFLNGGLFECLDPTPPKGQARAERELIDCFSNEHHARLVMPDSLFFGDVQVVDLSGDDGYGDKTRKKEKVRGLLRILKGYTFTITENTPLEEEVALDPELLGKVFENLLAAYNPETKTTARKQTGSFYTPREVVEYMVDESLLAYLRPFLPTGPVAVPALAQVVDQPNQTLFGQAIPQQATLGLGRPAPAAAAPDAEAALRHLLAMPDAPNPFNETDTWRLIDALDRFKLLDPACGSGAFPMGALQRLTYLLARLDPNNRHWKQLQLLRAKADHQTALTFQDAEVKRQAVAAAEAREKEIEVAFDTNNHELDYGRKLYLIENCLYGVDIQPVAVQITKLRCFIALLVEQKATAALADKPEKNLGIRPLPNLETKFVAANTLLRLESEAGQQSTVSLRIEALQKQLKEVRHEYFTVRGRQAKLALKQQDRTIRESLRQEFKASMMSGPDAERLANWDPYDLRASADFFSPEWMLNVPIKPDAQGQPQGFDAVIGNPPYVQLQSMKAASQLLAKQNFSLYSPSGDLYLLFYEKGFRLLRPGGVLCFITSNKWMRADYGSKPRGWFAKFTNPLLLVDFGGVPIFESATVDSNILLLQASSNKNQTLGCRVRREFRPDKQSLPEYVKLEGLILPKLTEESWAIGRAEYASLIKKVEALEREDNYL